MAAYKSSFGINIVFLPILWTSILILINLIKYKSCIFSADVLSGYIILKHFYSFHINLLLYLHTKYHL